MVAELGRLTNQLRPTLELEPSAGLVVLGLGETRWLNWNNWKRGGIQTQDALTIVGVNLSIIMVRGRGS